MAECRVQVGGLRAYFAELPYYLWGQVNYNSEGDCRTPRDRQWTTLAVQRRGSDECVDIRISDKGEARIEGSEDIIARTAMLLQARSGDRVSGHAATGDWNHAAGMARADLVRREFEQAVLAPFDTKIFWGGWKWIGGFATDCVWVDRWIMHALVRRDQRAIPLCIERLRGVERPTQIAALTHALAVLSGESRGTRQAWLRWYDGWWLRSGAKSRFPWPEVEAWQQEMEAEFRHLDLGGVAS